MAAYCRAGAIVVSILSVFADVDRSWAAQTKPQDALVLVTSHWRETRMSSHGLVVGDGSLVVALYPAVFDELAGGRHRLAKRVTVASPYWGDVADAEIVASDARKHLAILQVPWRGHPSLRLAGDKSIADADRMMVVGMPRVIEMLSGKSRGPVDASALFQEATAGVDYVAVREGKPSFVVLQGGGEISLPWAGTPILLPDTGRVAATVSSFLVNGGAEGEVLNRMGELVDRVRGVEPVTASETEHPLTENAREAFLLTVRIAALFGNEKYEETAAECRKLIELRPQCFYGYVYAAIAAEELGQASEADRAVPGGCGSIA